MKAVAYIVGGILTLGLLWFVMARFAGPTMKRLVSANGNLPSGGAAQAPPPNTSWNPFGVTPQVTAPIVPGATGPTQAAQASNQSGDLFSNLLSPGGLTAIGSLASGLGTLFNGGNSAMTPYSTYSTGGGIDTPSLYFPDDSSSYSDFFDGTYVPDDGAGLGGTFGADLGGGFGLV